MCSSGVPRSHNKVEISLVVKLYIHLSEPTSNVVPKSPGKKFERELLSASMKQTVALGCALQGFPVPITRYISSITVSILFVNLESCLLFASQVGFDLHSLNISSSRSN